MNNFIFNLSIIVLSLTLLLYQLNNLIVIICLFFSAISGLTILLVYNGFQLISYVFLIVYGGGLMVLYFVVVQFNSVLYYNNIVNLKKFNIFLSIVSVIILNINFLLTYKNTDIILNNIYSNINAVDIIYNFSSTTPIILLIVGPLLTYIIFISIFFLKVKKYKIY